MAEHDRHHKSGYSCFHCGTTYGYYRSDLSDSLYGNADQNEIPLSIGENAVTITVVNKEGITNTYKVTITREEDAGTGNVIF